MSHRCINQIKTTCLGLVVSSLLLSCVQSPSDVYIRDTGFNYGGSGRAGSGDTIVRYHTAKDQEEEAKRLQAVEESIKRHSDSGENVNVVPPKQTGYSGRYGLGKESAATGDGNKNYNLANGGAETATTESSRVVLSSVKDDVYTETPVVAPKPVPVVAPAPVVTKPVEGIKRSADGYVIIVIQPGDTVLGLAQKYEVSFSSIVDLNNLTKPYMLKSGFELKLPKNAKIIQEAPMFTYTVEEGDNLSYIAYKFNTSVNRIAELNQLQPPYRIRPKQQLKIAGSKAANVVAAVPLSKTGDNNKSKSNASTASSKNTTKYYTVEEGDNLYFVARQFGCSIQDLIKLNKLKEPYNIYPKQKLQIPKDAEKVVASNTKTTKSAKSNGKPVKDNTTTTSKQPTTTGKEVSDAELNRQIAGLENKSTTAQFSWPLKGKILDRFGRKNEGNYSDGIRIAAPEGTPFRAIADGVVVYVGNELKDFGYLIIIQHDAKWISAYGHSKITAVYKGQEVKRNQIIGYVGKEGNVTTPQLYLSLRLNNKAVDPEKYLK